MRPDERTVFEDGVWPAEVDRVLAGGSKAADRMAAERWVAARPRAGVLFEVLRDELDVVPHESLDVATLFVRIMREADVKLSAGRGRMIQSLSRVRPRSHWKRRITASAVAVACVAMAVVGWHSRQPAATTRVTATWVTATGEHALVTLPNGNLAHLAPGTQLDMMSEHGGVFRVRGQVLFTVAPNTKAPFVVRAGPSETRVLGTRFLVRHYETEQEARVAVVDGRVAVTSLQSSDSSNNPQAILGKQMLAILDDSGRVIVMPQIPADEITSWTEGRLVFRQLQIRDVVSQISRAYGVEITVADTLLAQRKLTWTISTRNRSLQGVLESLALFLDSRVVRTNAGVVIAPGRSVSRQHVPLKPILTVETSYGQ